MCSFDEKKKRRWKISRYCPFKEQEGGEMVGGEEGSRNSFIHYFEKGRELEDGKEEVEDLRREGDVRRVEGKRQGWEYKRK